MAIDAPWMWRPVSHDRPMRMVMAAACLIVGIGIGRQTVTLTAVGSPPVLTLTSQAPIKEVMRDVNLGKLPASESKRTSNATIATPIKILNPGASDVVPVVRSEKPKRAPRVADTAWDASPPPFRSDGPASNYRALREGFSSP